MPLFESIPLFLASLTCMIGGSVFLSRSMGRIGRRLDIPEQFLGFVTALGADSPEISSAVVAMLSGQRDVGVGVVFGSNLFNLAFLLGLTAVMSGRVAVRRAPVLLDGGVAVLVTACAVALAMGAGPPPLMLALILVLLTPYAVLLALRHGTLQKLPLPAAWKDFIVAAASESQQHSSNVHTAARADEEARSARNPEKPKPQLSLKQLAWRLLLALAVIVGASTGLVKSSTAITAGWLPKALLGTLVLAALTGIPNLYTATRLAKRQRGSAVMTEAMNSNSLNILVGLAVPALIFAGQNATTPGAYLDTGMLFVMTLAVVIVMTASQGLSRKQGAGIIAAYLSYVSASIYLAVR